MQQCVLGQSTEGNFDKVFSMTLFLRMEFLFLRIQYSGSPNAKIVYIRQFSLTQELDCAQDIY
jgi:hypothetical protein